MPVYAAFPGRTRNPNCLLYYGLLAVFLLQGCQGEDGLPPGPCWWVLSQWENHTSSLWAVENITNRVSYCSVYTCMHVQGGMWVCVCGGGGLPPYSLLHPENRLKRVKHGRLACKGRLQFMDTAYMYLHGWWWWVVCTWRGYSATDWL